MRRFSATSDIRIRWLPAWVRAGLVLVGIAAGLAAETFGARWDDPLFWAPDLAVGMAFFIAAAVLWPSARVAAVLALGTALTWFAGSVLDLALYWHRGPLIHLILLIPLSHMRSWPRRGCLLVAYLVCLVPAFWTQDFLALGLCACIVLVSWIPIERGRRAREPIRLTRWMAALFAGTITIGMLLSTESSNHHFSYAQLLQYEAVLLIIAVLVPLTSRDLRGGALADLVVEVGEGGSDSLTGALADALRDRRVRLGYWDAGHHEYRDLHGRPLHPPEDGSGLTATPFERDGERFALLIHDKSLDHDPRLIEAISAATLLTATNAELRSIARAQVEEVDASRRRIMVAADEELRILATRLDADVGAPLRGVATRIDERVPFADGDAAEILTSSRTRIQDILDAIDATALGLPPTELDGGLNDGLTRLGIRCSVATTVVAIPDRFDPATESALYFVAAEAITNSVKHASATSIAVTLALAADQVTLAVIDDGDGGADIAAGSGMAGMRDRVAALGGDLWVRSSPGEGTQVVAEVPLRGHPVP